LANWWNDNTFSAFENKTSCFVDQYSKYAIPIDGKEMNVNGLLTLAENIADNGGLYTAYQAWKRQPSGTPVGNERLKGMEKFTNEQLFFITYAQNWCYKGRDGDIEARLLSDFHAPNSVRVNGVVSNMKPFAEAFGCKPRTNMNPEVKCTVW
jgi:endothelin-converting enzyme